MRYPTLDFTPQSEIFIHSHMQQPGKNQRHVLPVYIVKKVSGEKYPDIVMRYPTLDFTPQSEILIHSHIQQPGKNQRYVLPIYIVKKISGEKEKRQMFQEI